MTRLLLDIDFATEPLSGTVETEDGAQHQFTGWLALSELLGRIGRGEEAASRRPKRRPRQGGAQPLEETPR